MSTLITYNGNTLRSVGVLCPLANVILQLKVMRQTEKQALQKTVSLPFGISVVFRQEYCNGQGPLKYTINREYCGEADLFSRESSSALDST